MSTSPMPIVDAAQAAANQVAPQPDNTATDVTTAQPTPTGAPTPPAAPQKPSLWKAVVEGALNGLAGSAGAKSFGGGLAAGAAGYMNAQAAQRQEARQNQQATDQHTMAQARVASTYADIAHTQQLIHNMPPDWQTAQSEKLADDTADMVSKKLLVPQGPAVTDWHQAQNQMTALMQKNPSRLFMAMPIRGDKGELMYQVMEAPDAPNQSDYSFTMPDGSTHTIPKGTMSSRDIAALEVQKIKQEVADQSTAAKANLIKANASMVKAGAAKTAAGGALQPDALGFQPKLPVTGAQGYAKLQGSFKKNADDLAQTEQTYQQFADILKDVQNGKDLTGAESIVGLFNAIGISAEPMKHKGFRINNLTVAEHAGARGIRQAIEQKFGRLRTGEIITPSQLADYARIAEQVRENKYVSMVNQAHNVGLNADPFLPTGNGQKADPSTARVFLRLVGWNGGPPTPQQKQAAQTAMQKKGWSF